ncbi:MAG TPA: molybdenum cofactor guanylyltransferase [Ktedonobacteraceae bacterium]|nr:molybdenum cofactor guanylyltransferase [Ktedonobacteraceae bacterium]
MSIRYQFKFMNSSNIISSGIILAGGYSRRMGKNKALLPHPGSQSITFVEYLASTLATVCPEVLIVARHGTDASGYNLPGARLVFDLEPDLGPLMGLYSGLSATTMSRALVVAVDMPFVQPALLSYLLSLPLTGAMLVPMVNDVPQVLLAIYPRSILPFIEERLRQGRRDPRSLLEVAPVQYIPEERLRQVDPELRSFINVNTPDELQRLM